MELPDRFRALLVGYPKAGKSGSLVSLLRAGYRVIYNDFDGNPEVLKLAGEHRANLIYLPYEDKVRMTGQDRDRRLSGISGEPKAFLNYMTLLETGKYVSPDGKTREDHGPMTSWGDDTFCVTDSITRLTEAIWARFLHTTGSKDRRKTYADWDAIVNELTYVTRMNMALRLSCHSVMIAHFQMVGDEPLEEDPKNERSKLVEHNNTVRAKKAELVGPRLFPKVVTKPQAETYTGLFPVVLPLISDDHGKRVFQLEPKKELMVALPASHAKLPKTLPQETGLLTIFNAVTGKGT